MVGRKFINYLFTYFTRSSWPYDWNRCQYTWLGLFLQMSKRQNLGALGGVRNRKSYQCAWITSCVFFALQALCSDKKNIHIRLMMDSITAVSYVREQGGSKSTACNKIARKIWISSEHLVGALNVTADFESRNFQKETEWMLDRSVFQKINSKLGFKPDIDLFASKINFQLPRFVSWKPQPGCFAVTAFSLNWQNLKPYCFPPFRILPKVLQKISLDEATEIVIIPNWPTQVFYATAINMLIDNPIYMKKHKRLLQLPNQPEEIHTIWNTGPSGVPVIRQSIARQGLLKEASDIIIAGWRRTTSKQYQTYLRKWEIYCSKWETDPLCASLIRILEFLTQLVW